MKNNSKIGTTIIIIVTIIITLFMGNNIHKIYKEQRESLHPQNRSD